MVLLVDVVLVEAHGIDSPARRAGDDGSFVGCAVDKAVVVVVAAAAVVGGFDDSANVENPSEQSDWDARVGVQDAVDRNGDTDGVGGVAVDAVVQDDWCIAPFDENLGDGRLEW